MQAATLTVDLSAVRANFRLLKSRHANHNIAAVVKANAYGLGMEQVAKVLSDEGSNGFFVATLEEAIELRGYLPAAPIAVFNGMMKGEETLYRQHKIKPVLNDMAQVDRMTDDGWRMAPILHIDTGMTRLGLTESDLKKIRNPEAIRYVMSHLACANEPQHAKNTEQLSRFKTALQYFPHAKASLCNSSGVFLDEAFHFGLARPGCALYGINPTNGANPMQHVATLSAPLLQMRTLDRDETVGYGGTHNAKKGSLIAIAALGYADGYFRSLSNKGHAHVAGHRVPLMGRVSMDMIALEVSAVPQEKLAGARAEFINAEHTVDDVANACGTIGYEIFTRIGRRVKREYI